MPRGRLLDISMPLFPGMPRFPGDPPFRRRRVRSLDRGAAYNLSAIGLGTHAGTHVDPPLHFVRGGAPIDRVDPGTLCGPCAVVRVDDSVEAIGAAEVARLPRNVPRVLFRTANSGQWRRRLRYFPRYTALTEAGARALLARGVRVVGLDALSVERDPSGTFPVHRLLLGRGVLILEGLLLDGVPPGRYSLVCLPLKLRDGDGGPARALLAPAGR